MRQVIGWALVGLFAVLLCAVAGCSDSGAATRTLWHAGYKNVHITGWSPLSCSDSDSTCTGFEATAPDGSPVGGAVGCGYFFKGCTVRLK